MIRMTSGWAPAFTREVRRPGVNVQMGQLAPLVPPTQPPSKLAVLGTGAAVLGVSVATVLFTYGLATASPSKMVRNSGYVLAGVGAIATLAEAWALGNVLLKA